MLLQRCYNKGTMLWGTIVLVLLNVLFRITIELEIDHTSTLLLLGKTVQTLTVK